MPMACPIKIMRIASRSAPKSPFTYKTCRVLYLPSRVLQNWCNLIECLCVIFFLSFWVCFNKCRISTLRHRTCPSASFRVPHFPSQLAAGLLLSLCAGSGGYGSSVIRKLANFNYMFLHWAQTERAFVLSRTKSCTLNFPSSPCS